MYLKELDSEIGPQPYINYLNSSQHGYSGSGSSSGNRPQLGWNYPAEYQNLVHEHWRGFTAPEIYFSVGFFIGFCIMMTLSIFGNGLVLWIFSTSKNLRTPSNLLILNLAVFDLLMCSNMPHFLFNTGFGYIIGGNLGCDIYAMNGGISGIGASITNAFIAFDRYRTISNPIDGRLSYGQVGILITVSWLWTLPFSILPFFQIWGRYQPEGFLTTCTFDYLTDNDETRYFEYSIFVWSYCIPMVMIVTYYGKLFKHVRAHESMLAEQARKMNVKSLSANANTDSMSVELRIARAALIIYMLFLTSWTPYSAVTLLGCSGQAHLVTPIVSMLPGCCAKVVSCLDPWVYAASHPKYRLELERRLPWLGIRERNHASAAASGGDRTSSDAGETSTVVLAN